MQECLGTVVPVDDEQSVTFQVPGVTNASISSNVPSQPVPTGPGPGHTTTGGTGDHNRRHTT